MSDCSNEINQSTPDSLHYPSAANTSAQELNNDICKTGDNSEDTQPDLESVVSDERYVKEFVAVGNWGTFGSYDTEWCDKFRPFVKITNYEDLELTDEEKDGCLTERVVASCSSYLTKCPHFAKYVLGKCNLRSKGLGDVEILKRFFYLQYIDLSRNKLRNVSVLGNLPLLMYLDVSYNFLDQLLNFRAPHNLIYVNYSHNNINKINSLKAFWSIKTLNLSYNKIAMIEGLQYLRYLETLDLSHNNITKIENLDHMNIITLQLHHNQINSFVCSKNRGFKTLPYLTYVRLDYNELTSLKIFEDAIFLQSINMEENQVSSVMEISSFANIPFLIAVNLNKNPVKLCENYETVCLSTIKSIIYLDGELVDIDKKAFAQAPFSFCQKMQSAQDHVNILTLSHLSKLPHLGINVIPVDQPFRPLIVVVSPIGSKEEVLIERFVNKYSKHVMRLITHTDREKFGNETDNNYHFVSPQEFNKLLESGEFLLVYSILNDNYGLSQTEYGKGVSEIGKVMITQVDLISALTLRFKGFNPCMVLAMPYSDEIHKQWLIETYETQIYNIRYPEAAVKLAKRDNVIYTNSTVSSFDVYYESASMEEQTNNTTAASSSGCSTTGEEPEMKTETYPVNTTTDSIVNYIKADSDSKSDQCENYNNYIRKLKKFQDYCYKTDDKYEEVVELDENDLDKESKLNYSSYRNYEQSSHSSYYIPQELIQNFYTQVLQTRKLYADFHRTNPGFFSVYVPTDDIETGMDILKDITKVAMAAHNEEIQVKFKRNYVCQSMIDERIRMFEKDINNAMSKNFY